MPEEVQNSNDASQLDLLSEVLPEVVSAFRRLDEDGRQKLFKTVGTLFGFDQELRFGSTIGPQVKTVPDKFSRERPISPKEFLLQKQPRTDVERVACLAYYLTHYREQPYFKTLDISKLNTEAAQIKFSNPHLSVNNAAITGYLAQASGGSKQLSAPGEQFVAALPDRDAAQTAMESARPRRRSKRSKEQRRRRAETNRG